MLRPWQKVVLVTILGLLSTGLWLGEVFWVKGWEGLRWLQGYPWAGPVTALAVALGILVTGAPAMPSLRRSVVFSVVVWAVLWASFEMSRIALGLLLATRHVPYGNAPWEALQQVAVLPIAILLASAAIHASTSRLLGGTSRWTTVYVAVAFVLVVPASFLTIQIIPALNRARDYIHAVKMGYPAFWTVVLVSAAVALGRRRSALQ